MLKKEHGHKIIKAVKVLVVLLLITGVYFLFTKSPWIQQYLDNPLLFQEFILGFGVIAPFVLILLQILDNILPLIPTEIIYIAAGFVFGTWWGSVYCLIGAFVGSAIVFKVSQRYGKGLAERVFNKKEVVHFSLFLRKNESWAIFIARVAPIFPNDLISFVAGLTKMKFSSFNLSSTLGFVVEIIVLAYIGSALSSGISWTAIIVFSIFLGLSLMAMIFKHRIKKLLIKDIHRLEKDARWVEKEFKKI